MGVDHADLAGPPAGQREAGVGRRARDRGHAGGDVVADALLGQGGSLEGQGPVEDRIAGHEPHDAAALERRLDHELDPVGVVGDVPVVIDGDEDLRVDPGVGARHRLALGIGHHHVGVTQQSDRAHGEQSGVPRSGRDQ